MFEVTATLEESEYRLFVNLDLGLAIAEGFDLLLGFLAHFKFIHSSKPFVIATGAACNTDSSPTATSNLHQLSSQDFTALVLPSLPLFDLGLVTNPAVKVVAAIEELRCFILEALNFGSVIKLSTAVEKISLKCFEFVHEGILFGVLFARFILATEALVTNSSIARNIVRVGTRATFSILFLD